MRVKVTINGTINLAADDVVLLEAATPEEAMQTLLASDTGITVVVERPSKKEDKVKKTTTVSVRLAPANDDTPPNP